MPHEAALGREVSSAGTGLPNGMIARKTFKATFRWVRRAIHETMEILETHDLTAGEMGTVEIVLAEALNNIVEHAYPHGEPGNIDLSLRLRPTGLIVEVRDRGKPMPSGRAPIGNHPMAEYEHDPMPEGGYGWYLIRELVRDLVYDRRDGENFLIFRLSIGAKPTQG